MTKNEKEDQTNTEVIMAAGGILERSTSDGVEIAIIRRERYGDEWALPKGKVKSDESLTQAAAREVEEETGFSVSVKRFAGVSHYSDEGKPKVVLYWLMVSTGGAFTPSDEVKELEWLAPETAQRCLTHRDQRDLLESVYGAELYHEDGNLLKRAWWWFLRNLYRRRRYLRLVSKIETYRKELQCLQTERNTERLAAASDLLITARESAHRGLIDKGWRQLQTAVRMETLALGVKTDKDRLQARAVTLRREISKIKKWRERAAEKLLMVREGEDIPPLEHIYQAMLLRDEHYNNQAYKDSLQQWHVLLLGLMLIALVAVLLLGLVPLTANDAENADSQLFVAVAFFGLLGGTLSAVIKVPKNTEDSRIPELVSTVRLTLLRLVAGAGAAIVVVMAVRGGFLDLFNPEVIGLDGNGNFYGLYTIAFAAGFSERLVLKAAEGWAGK